MADTYSNYLEDMEFGTPSVTYGLHDVDHRADTTVHVTAENKAAWNAKASTDVVTTSANGLMSSTDKTKLDGIDTGANKYTLPAAAQTVLGGVKIYKSGSTLYISTT